MATRSMYVRKVGGSWSDYEIRDLGSVLTRKMHLKSGTIVEIRTRKTRRDEAS